MLGQARVELTMRTQISGSATIPLKTMIDHFRIWPVPVRPPAPDEEYLAGERVVPARDYLLYSRLHLPTLHLSGLATTRLSPTLQAHVAFVHQPALVARPSQAQAQMGGATASGQPLPSPTTASAPAVRTPGNFLVSLQQDTGRWSAEYSYSAADGMIGLRGLYNFGMTRLAQAEVEPTTARAVLATTPARSLEIEDGKRVDEEEAMEGGLKGRFSAGAELYFSKKQRSLGGEHLVSASSATSADPSWICSVSTGLRFTTLPPATSTTPATSPPTTLTILYNPIIGYLSAAYSAQVSPHVALSSRYGLNVYSYESELTVGGEWWIGSGRGIGGWRGLRESDREGEAVPAIHWGEASRGEEGQRDGVLKGKISGSGVSIQTCVKCDDADNPCVPDRSFPWCTNLAYGNAWSRSA